MENSESIKNDLDKLARRWAGWIEETVARNALALIENLEEENMCMKIQMHGDCGVCKHRSEQEAVFRKAAKKGEFAFTQRCEDCIKNGKSAWEYEGLPEVKSR